jgi:hypothetical protein
VTGIFIFPVHPGRRSNAMQADDGDEVSADIHVWPTGDAAQSARQAAERGRTVFV